MLARLLLTSSVVQYLWAWSLAPLALAGIAQPVGASTQEPVSCLQFCPNAVICVPEVLPRV